MTEVARRCRRSAGQKDFHIVEVMRLVAAGKLPVAERLLFAVEIGVVGSEDYSGTLVAVVEPLFADFGPHLLYLRKSQSGPSPAS